MISISISIAFIIGYFASPSKIINDLLLEVGFDQNSTLKSSAALSIQYIIPALLTYFAAVKTGIHSRLIVSRKALWSLRACNAISIIYLAARFYARFIPGGGAGYAVSVLSALTILPAILVSMIIIARIAKRSFGTAGIASSAALYVLVLSMIPLQLYLEKLRADGVWDEYCKESGDRFISKPKNFTFIQFISVGELNVYSSVVGQYYSEAHRENIGKSLIKRGIIQEYETDDGATLRPPKRVFMSDGIKEESLIESRASHSVSISFPPYGKYPSLARHTITIKDLKTGNIIAESRVVEDLESNNKRVCGEVRRGTIDSSEFVRIALGLRPIANK